LAFPLFIFLCLNIVRAEWQDFPGIIAGFHTGQTIDINDVLEWTPALSVSHRFGNIYRKKISEAIASSVLQQNSELSFSYPFSTGQSSHIISIQSRFRTITGNNQEDATAVSANLSGQGTDSRLLWAGTDGIGFLALGIRYAADTYESDINIQQFPVSDTENINEYFLNWLPSTFGNSIDVPTATQVLEIEAWGSTKVSDKRVRLYFDRLQTNNDFTFNYLNSSNNATLSGKRQLDLPVSTRNTLASIALISPGKIISFTSMEIFSTKITLDTDHRSFGATDFQNLGNGNLSRTGISIRSGISVYKNEFQVGISTIDYSAKFLLKTPLLGYAADPIIGLEIIPIAHWADGKLGNSKSFSQLIGWSRKFQIHNTNLLFSGEYIHTKYKFNIQGDALR